MASNRKTLAQEHAELAERFAAACKSLEDGASALAAAVTERDAAISRAEALANIEKQLRDELAGHIATGAELTTARDSEKARADALADELAKCKATLAMTGIPGVVGVPAIADGGQAGSGSPDMTWPQAVEKHGYSTARKMFPGLYNDFMKGNR